MLNLSILSNKLAKLVLLLSVGSALTGCTTIGRAMNPFESDFVDCSKEENIGMCSSVEDSYSDALAAKNYKSITPPKKEQPDIPGRKTISLVEDADNSYRTATLQKITKLLKEPTTPMVAAPTVLRVLILPYKDDDNGLNLMRYSYLMVDQPRWIMGDYLEEVR